MKTSEETEFCASCPQEGARGKEEWSVVRRGILQDAFGMEKGNHRKKTELRGCLTFLETSSVCFILFCVFVLCLGIKPRALCTPDKYSTHEYNKHT